MTSPADESWESQKDDVFNIVADIEVPSEQIRYAFLAGHCAAMGAPLPVFEATMCRACQVDDHAACYYWERRRSWAPCVCENALHKGKPAPVYR
jgi:hypothetical protein